MAQMMEYASTVYSNLALRITHWQRQIQMTYVRNIRMQFFILVAAIISCIIYVVQTYRSDLQTTSKAVRIESPFSIIFVLDYFLNAFGAPSLLAYVFGWDGLVDGLAIIPSLTLLVLLTSPHDLHSVGFVKFLRAAKVFRVLRLSRVIKLRVNSYQNLPGDQSVPLEVSRLCVSLLSIIFIAAGVVYEIENSYTESFYPGEQFEFHVAVYFMIATCTTLGYGDIYPNTTATRMLIIVVMIISFTLIPYQVSNLISTMTALPKYSKPLKLSYVNDHVVICGGRPSTSLARLCEEIFHANHILPDSRRELVVAVLSPLPPSKQQKAVMQHPYFVGRIHWIVGTTASPTDLAKVRADKAKAIFILRTQSIQDHATGEDDVFLRTISALRYIARNLEAGNSATITDTAPDDSSYDSSRSGLGRDFPLTIVETAASSCRNTLYRAGVDLVMCNVQLKYAVLAYGTIFPGFIALFLNLVKSDPHDLSRLQKDTWQYDYASGGDYELYTVNLEKDGSVCNSLKECTFIQAAAALYGSTDGKVLLLGLESSSGEVLINPAPIRGSKPLLLGTCCNAFVFALTAQEAVSALRIAVPQSDDKVKAEGAGTRRADEVKSETINISRSNTFINLYAPSTMTELNTPARDVATLRTVQSAPNILSVASSQPGEYKLELGQDISYDRPVSANFLHLSNHVVVCVCSEIVSTYALENFLSPLRAITSDTVVVLCEQADSIEESVRRRARHQNVWEGVHFKSGSPKDADSLLECGVRTARAVVVMGLNVVHEEWEAGSEHRVYSNSDRHSVITTIKLQDVLEGNMEKPEPVNVHPTFTVTELSSDSSVYFLKQHSGDSTKVKWTGNRRRVPVRRETVRLLYSTSVGDEVFDWPMFAQGKIITPSIFDSFMVQCMYNHATLSFWEALLHIKRTRNPRRRSRFGANSASNASSASFLPSDEYVSGMLQKLSVPLEFRGKPYEELLTHLMRNNQVPIGLYRYMRAKQVSHAQGLSSPQQRTAGSVRNSFRRLLSPFTFSRRESVQVPESTSINGTIEQGQWEFVDTIPFTQLNPPPQTILCPRDEVFVIDHFRPPSTTDEDKAYELTDSAS